VSNVFDFVAKLVNYNNLDITTYPLNNVSEGGAFNDQSFLWSPIPAPNISAVGAGGPILPLLTKGPPATQASLGRPVIEDPVVLAVVFAVAGTWYLQR